MNSNLIQLSHPLRLVPEIFVVDDDENIRELLTGALVQEGYPVKTFEEGESFLREATARVPICVFLDLVMPGRSGLEILKELKARRYRAPIILVSAQNDPPIIVEAIKNGACDYITKPFDRHAPALRVRGAIETWTDREPGKRISNIQSTEICDWFLLTPSEQELIALARTFDTLRN
jgi:two-component system response regulator FixJ